MGLVLGNIASLIFAILVRQLYLHTFDVLPIKGDLGALDISFLGAVFLFRFLVSVLIEFFLEHKYYTPFFGELKGVITLNMNNNTQGHPGQGSSGQSSSGQGSSHLTPSNLSDSLVTPSSEDRVVLEKHGYSITDTFILNVQTKLYRGVAIFIAQEDIKTRGVSFADAIRSVNSSFPNCSFSSEDEQKIKLLLAEKGVYKGALPYDKIPLNNVTASTPKHDHKNIAILLKTKEQ